jgi:carbonic anhydrase/acetyltransferase-like protein (isoleucine patch superfamily)
MAIWQLGNAVPRIHPTAYVHPSAQVIGDVTLRAHTSVWPGAVLRADFGQIDVGEGSSVQDNCILHPGSRQPTRIGSDCIIGHGVHLEGVLIEHAVLIGSGSILLSGARVRTGAATAAGALVLENTEIPPGHRAQGFPARLVPSDHDPERVRAGARKYRALAQRYAAGLRACETEPLDRPPIGAGPPFAATPREPSSGA